MRRVIGLALLMAQALPALAEDKPGGDGKVKPEKIWQGYVQDEDLLAKTPPPDFITDAKAFEAHWKAWKLGDKVPEVDFKTELVVMMAERRTVLTFDRAWASDKDLLTSA
jgi:hypothetical protein